MAYSNVVTDATDPTFMATVKAAMLDVAYDRATDNTKNQAPQQLAFRVILKPDDYAPQFAWMVSVAKNARGATVSTDAQFKTVVGVIFDGAAGR